jgi:hypothetical protein
VPEFVAGRELSRMFYEEVVAGLVGDVPHSAALLGTGSDVLGLDTERSTDHGWGPRLHLFVVPADVARVERAIDEGLPAEFHGWPTRYGWDDVPVTHHVQVLPLGDWLRDRLGFDPRDRVTAVDWLAAPQQLLLETTDGVVHHDERGELAAVRRALAWYPDDVWLWLLACQWRRIDQEEPFVGRAAEVGDTMGSSVLAARLVRDVIRLCFLLERQYAPYAKWLGTRFRELEAHDQLGDALLDVLSATDYTAREDALVRTMQAAAALHNERGVTSPVDESVRRFHGRPFKVLGASRFVDACLERVTDPRLRAVPLVGGIDQLADSVDLLSEPIALRAARDLYESWLS